MLAPPDRLAWLVVRPSQALPPPDRSVRAVGGGPERPPPTADTAVAGGGAGVVAVPEGVAEAGSVNPLPRRTISDPDGVEARSRISSPPRRPASDWAAAESPGA